MELESAVGVDDVREGGGVTTRGLSPLADSLRWMAFFIRELQLDDVDAQLEPEL